MTPVMHRRGGRRFGGAFDSQRVERFAPGNRGEAFGAGVLWTKGINAVMKSSTGTGATMRTSSGVPTDMNPEA